MLMHKNGYKWSFNQHHCIIIFGNDYSILIECFFWDQNHLKRHLFGPIFVKLGKYMPFLPFLTTSNPWLISSKFECHIAIFSSTFPCLMSIFNTYIDNEEDINIQTINYNHFTKLLPAKSCNCHMQNFGWLNAQASLMLDDGVLFWHNCDFCCLTLLDHMSHDMTKPTKLVCAQRRLRSVWSVFAVRMKKAWVLSYPLSTQWRLIRLGGCPGWSVFAARTLILLVLSCRGSCVKFTGLACDKVT